MNDTLNGPRILSALKASGIEVVVSVPDIVTSEGFAAADLDRPRPSPRPGVQGG